MTKIQWKLIEESTCARDATIDFLEGICTFKEYLSYIPKTLSKQIKQRYKYYCGHPQKIGGKDPIMHIQDLLAESLKRRGWNVEKTRKYNRYYVY